MIKQTVEIHIGSNDITKMTYKTFNVQDLVQRISGIGLKSKLYGVSRIAIASILTRRKAQVNQVIGKVKNLLKNFMCYKCFHYKLNDMVDHRMLRKDVSI